MTGMTSPDPNNLRIDVASMNPNRMPLLIPVSNSPLYVGSLYQYFFWARFDALSCRAVLPSLPCQTRESAHLTFKLLTY